MTLGVMDPADKARLTNLVNEGVQVMNDVQALKESLKETVDTISEEMDIKKSVLNKAIRIAWKNTQNRNALEDTREELDEIEQVLMNAGLKV
tara:strand:- start:24725 stop:25000 length:276 start_codon:yes stop_codon:yes gene_type:complete